RSPWAATGASRRAGAAHARALPRGRRPARAVAAPRRQAHRRRVDAPLRAAGAAAHALPYPVSTHRVRPGRARLTRPSVPGVEVVVLVAGLRRRQRRAYRRHRIDVDDFADEAVVVVNRHQDALGHRIQMHPIPTVAQHGPSSRAAYTALHGPTLPT